MGFDNCPAQVLRIVNFFAALFSQRVPNLISFYLLSCMICNATRCSEQWMKLDLPGFNLSKNLKKKKFAKLYGAVTNMCQAHLSNRQA